jgi:hypothetical protein
VLALSNYCFRDSLRRIANLIQHGASDRRQLGHTEGGGFSIPDMSKFPPIGRAELIELIGRRGYQSFAPDDKVGIVNLLENDSDDSSADFAILLLIHWTWHHTEHYSQNWPRLVDLKILQDHLEKSLPGHPMVGKLQWAIERAQALGLLDDVLDQYDPERVLHHLMPRADVWAAAGFIDTLLRWKMKLEVVHGNEKAIQPGIQA